MPRSTIKKQVLVIADYGKDDLAFYEVKQRLLGLNPNLEIDFLSVKAFNTAEAAFAVEIGAKSGRYDGIYHNIAPRKDKKNARAANHGEGLAYARVNADNGRTVEVVGVASTDSAGHHTFGRLVHSFHPGGVYSLAFRSVGSQFRSRDEFPAAFVDILSNCRSDIREEITGSIQPLTATPTVEQERDRARNNFRALQARPYWLGGEGRDYENGYITVITPREQAIEQLETLGRIYPEKLIDVLPIDAKDEESFGYQAGFAGAQLAYNATHPAKNGREVIAAFYGLETLVEGNRFRLDPRRFSFARQYAHGRNTSLKADSRSFIDYAAVNSGNHVWDENRPDNARLVLAYHDGYGNCKLSQSKDDVLAALKKKTDFLLEEDEIAIVSILVTAADGKDYAIGKAYLSDSSFGVPEGEVAFSRGSSGWSGLPLSYDSRSAPPAGLPPWRGRESFAEIFLRGGNAWARLGRPEPGSEIHVRYLDKARLRPSTLVTGDDRQLTVSEPTHQRSL